MEEAPALLWTAADMDPREDGVYPYVPTQLHPPIAPDRMPHDLPRIALRRLRMMSATEHFNALVGNIYIGNCVEPMAWAGEHVGYIIDASHGTSDVECHHCLSLPRAAFPIGTLSSSSVPCEWSHVPPGPVLRPMHRLAQELRVASELHSPVALREQGRAS